MTDLGKKLELAEVVTIKNIEQIYETCVAYLQQQQPITLVADKVRRIDTAGLQLLVAFINTAKTQSLSVVWEAPSDYLLQQAKLIGLEDLLDFAC